MFKRKKPTQAVPKPMPVRQCFFYINRVIFAGATTPTQITLTFDNGIEKVLEYKTALDAEDALNHLCYKWMESI